MLAMIEKSKEIAHNPVAERDARVHEQLQNWARWMGSGRTVDRLPSRASGRAENYSSMDNENSDEAYERMNIRLASICNRVINDLDPVEGAAIMTEYLHAVFRFNRHQFDVVLARAVRNVARGLIAKGVWLG